MAQDSEWLTVKEMQQMLALGRSKTYEILTHEEEIETVQIGTAIRVNKVSLERWLAGQRYPRWRNDVNVCNGGQDSEDH